MKTEHQNIKQNNIIETKVTDVFINNNFFGINESKNINKNTNTKTKQITNNNDKKEKFGSKANSENKNATKNRLITGKKINRKIFYHMENKNEKKYNDSEDDSFNKNINCISDDESEDSITKRKSNNEESIKNELNDLKENNISKAIKKKRIQELIEEIEQSEKANNRTKNLNNQIYNKKNIKLSKLNIY